MHLREVSTLRLGKEQLRSNRCKASNKKRTWIFKEEEEEAGRGQALLGSQNR